MTMHISRIESHHGKTSALRLAIRQMRKGDTLRVSDPNRDRIKLQHFVCAAAYREGIEYVAPHIGDGIIELRRLH